MGTTKDLLKVLLICGVANLASGIYVTRLRADSDCPMVGFFRDETNCRKFYRCAEHPTGVSGESYIIKAEFDCPQGTIFDEATSSCNHIMFVQNIPPGCDISQSTPPTVPDVPPPSQDKLMLPEHSQMVPKLPGREQVEFSSMLPEPPMPPSLPSPLTPPKLAEPATGEKPPFSPPPSNIPAFPGVNIKPPMLPPFPAGLPPIPGIPTKPAVKPAPIPSGVKETSVLNVEQEQTFFPFQNLNSGSFPMAFPVNVQGIPNLSVGQFQINTLSNQQNSHDKIPNLAVTAINAGPNENLQASWVAPQQFPAQDNTELPVKQESNRWVVPNNFPTFYSPYTRSPILVQAQSHNIPTSPIILIR